MNYYHSLITDKSWKFLQQLKRHYNFILIGGWAVYSYTKALKSRDIDVICNYEELEKLKADYSMTKNDRLKKYEIHIGEFDIDIYVPFYSDLGIPAEEIFLMTKTISGYIVPDPEVLLILKQRAFEERKHSIKGEKDKIDIISILKYGIDFKKYFSLLKRFNLEKYQNELKKIITETREVQEINLNKHQYAVLKKQILKSVV